MRALLRNGKLPRPRLDVEEYVRTRPYIYGHGEWAGNGLRSPHSVYARKSIRAPIKTRYVNESGPATVRDDERFIPEKCATSIQFDNKSIVNVRPQSYVP